MPDRKPVPSDEGDAEPPKRVQGLA
jgi:hypothetical protein